MAGLLLAAVVIAHASPMLSALTGPLMVVGYVILSDRSNHQALRVALLGVGGFLIALQVWVLIALRTAHF
jgi:hypothetical protein